MPKVLSGSVLNGRDNLFIMPVQRGGVLPGQHQLHSFAPQQVAGIVFVTLAVWTRYRFLNERLYVDRTGNGSPRSRLMWWSWMCSPIGASEGTCRRRNEGGKRKKKKAGVGAGLINSVYLKHPIAFLVLIAVTSESLYSAIGQFCIIYERNERRGAARSSQERRTTAQVYISSTLGKQQIKHSAAVKPPPPPRTRCFTHTLADLRAPVVQEVRTTRQKPFFFDAAGPSSASPFEHERLSSATSVALMMKSGQSERGSGAGALVLIKGTIC